MIRLDTYLQDYIEKKYGTKLSRSYIERLLMSGGVTYNNEIIKKKGFSFNPDKQVPLLDEEKVQQMIAVYSTGVRQDAEADAWDASEKDIELDERRVARAGDLKPSIIFESDDVLAVNKPPGVLSHPGRGDRGADSMVYQFIKYMRREHRYIPRAGLLHRLDKDTQGVLLFAKNMETYNSIKAQFQQRTLQKYYVARCEFTASLHPKLSKAIEYLRKASLPSLQTYASVPELVKAVTMSQKPIVLDGYIGRKKGTPYMVYQADEREKSNLIGIKPCRSDIYIIAVNETEVDLLFIPHTGRTHQIRAQARFLGAPVKNDPMYGYSNTHTGTLGLTAVSVLFELKGKVQQISLKISEIA